MSQLQLISALLHLLVGWRLVGGLWAWPAAAGVLALALAASAVLLPMGLSVRHAQHGSWAARRGVAGLLCMGLFSSLFVLTLLRDAAQLLLAAADWLQLAWAIDRAAFAHWSAAAVPLLALAVTAWGAVNARRTAAVVAVDVPIANLPAELHGFTIAQISDVHVGSTIRRPYVQAIVDRVNALRPDMVAVTGDLVDGSVAELAPHVAPLAGLASRHGTYFVTGNHEYYSGAGAWVAHLRRIGMHVLMNQHVVLRHGGGALLLAGVADHGAHHFDASQRSDAAAALAGAPAGVGVKVLLAHQPRSAFDAADAGFDLQLSGHTHGGQFWPWMHFVRLQQPFTAGLHRLRNLWVYTSRGTGYWGPPKRFGAASEITRLRLVPAAA